MLCGAIGLLAVECTDVDPAAIVELAELAELAELVRPAGTPVGAATLAEPVPMPVADAAVACGVLAGSPDAAPSRVEVEQPASTTIAATMTVLLKAGCRRGTPITESHLSRKPGRGAGAGWVIIEGG
jgi:hypothetical protein